MTPAAYANLGAMPMLMITGQKPIKKSKQGRFQIIDTIDMMRPITKYSKQIVNGNSIPSMTREAFRIAQEERPGAVHLELPEDIAAEDCEERLFEVVGYRRPDADDQAITKATQMIKEAKMPLILIGAGANRKRTSEALRKLVETLKPPILPLKWVKGLLMQGMLNAWEQQHCQIMIFYTVQSTEPI